MGWWKVQDSEDLVGDDPFDILRIAAVEVSDLYEHEWGRRPTRSEWQRLLRNALEVMSENHRPGPHSLFDEDVVPTSVEICVKPRAL